MVFNKFVTFVYIKIVLFFASVFYTCVYLGNWELQVDYLYKNQKWKPSKQKLNW